MKPRALADYWYPVAHSAWVAAGELQAFELLGRSLVLFRADQGQVTCLEDRCPHRSVPLHCGRVREGALECLYHGWRFGAGGSCLEIPSLPPGAQPAGRTSAVSLPCEERHGAIWVWPGEGVPLGDPGEPAEIFLEREPGSWTVHEFQRDLEVPHELMIENLLDPSHLPFTHDGTLARRRDAQALEMEVREGEDRVVGETLWPDSPERTRQRLTFLPPCVVRLDLATPSGRMIQLHSCVPLSKGKMRMVYWFAYDFLGWTRWVPGLKWLTRRFNDRIIDQDLEMLAGQARAIEAGASPWGATVPADALALAYRRWFQRASSLAV